MSRDVCMFDPMASCHHDCDECGPLPGDSCTPHVSQTGNVPAAGNKRAGRIGTIYLDTGTGECVMPADFVGDEELRWTPAHAAGCAETVTPNQPDRDLSERAGPDKITDNVPDSQIAIKKDVPASRHVIADNSADCQMDVPRAGRTFPSGAYRDADDDKYDYEGFLSPLVLEAYAAYMHRHRRQSDGHLRDSDNWQRGIPPEQYVKSAFRHFMDLWMEHRCHASRDGIDEALGGLLFNICGVWHELLIERRGGRS